MGGFLSATSDVLEKVFQETNWSAIGQWLLPAMSTIEHTPAGKVAGNILRNKFEPELAQTTAHYRNVYGFTPEIANRLAVRDVGKLYFGARGEGLVNLLKAVEQQSGGNKIHTNNFADAMDIYLGEKGFMPNWRQLAMQQGVGGLTSTSSKYVPRGPIEKGVKEVASWIFLPRIVIPHLTQPLNVLLYDGASAFGKATRDMLADGPARANARIIMSGALEDQILYNITDTAKGGGLARKLFHMPGFNFVREMQITHSALAGEYAIKDAWSEYLANGRRLTPELELVFQRHGVDLGQLRSGQIQQLTPEMIRTAQFRAAQSTYFIRSGLDTPYTWGQNWMSRNAMLYKHFSYNQGRFVVKSIKESFKASPEEGLKTLALLATVYPMAGYAVSQVEDAINLKPAPKTAAEQDEAWEQYVQALGHAAGFGIAYSIFRSAKRNALADYAIGPVPSTVLDYTQDIINAPSSRARRQNLGRDFLRRVPLVGPALQQTYLPTRRRRRTR